MDPAKVFVLILVVLVIAVLAYLEMKSRRSPQPSALPAETDQDTKKPYRR